MLLQLTENQSRTIGLATIALLAVLMLVWILNGIAATAAYRKAMLAIAEAARKGDGVTLQVANFTQTAISDNGKPGSN